MTDEVAETPKRDMTGYKARRAMRKYGITLGKFGDRRIIYNDHDAPDRAIELVRKALKAGKIA